MPLRDVEGGGRPGSSATVGTASSVVLKANGYRKRVCFVNDSDTAIYLSKSDVATVNNGIRLNAEGGSYNDKPDRDGYIYVGPYSAISSAANKNLCIQEG